MVFCKPNTLVQALRLADGSFRVLHRDIGQHEPRVLLDTTIPVAPTGADAVCTVTAVLAPGGDRLVLRFHSRLQVWGCGLLFEYAAESGVFMIVFGHLVSALVHDTRLTLLDTTYSATRTVSSRNGRIMQARFTTDSKYIVTHHDGWPSTACVRAVPSLVCHCCVVMGPGSTIYGVGLRTVMVRGFELMWNLRPIVLTVNMHDRMMVLLACRQRRQTGKADVWNMLAWRPHVRAQTLGSL